MVNNFWDILWVFVSIFDLDITYNVFNDYHILCILFRLHANGLCIQYHYSHTDVYRPWVRYIHHKTTKIYHQKTHSPSTPHDR